MEFDALAPIVRMGLALIGVIAATGGETAAGWKGGGMAAMRANRSLSRRGVATLDYVLLMGIVLPLAAFVLWAAPRMMNRVYEFTTALTGLPF